MSEPRYCAHGRMLVQIPFVYHDRDPSEGWVIESPSGPWRGGFGRPVPDDPCMPCLKLAIPFKVGAEPKRATSKQRDTKPANVPTVEVGSPQADDSSYAVPA